MLFRLASKFMLGLWARAGVLPPAAPFGHGAKLGIPLADDAALASVYTAVTVAGCRILQQPTPMSFGTAFTLADPDGHPIRVFAVARPSA